MRASEGDGVRGTGATAGGLGGWAGHEGPLREQEAVLSLRTPSPLFVAWNLLHCVQRAGTHTPNPETFLKGSYYRSLSGPSYRGWWKKRKATYLTCAHTHPHTHTHVHTHTVGA